MDSLVYVVEPFQNEFFDFKVLAIEPDTEFVIDIIALTSMGAVFEYLLQHEAQVAYILHEPIPEGVPVLEYVLKGHYES